MERNENGRMEAKRTGSGGERGGGIRVANLGELGLRIWGLGLEFSDLEIGKEKENGNLKWLKSGSEF